MAGRTGTAWSLAAMAGAFVFMGQTGVVDFATNVASRYKTVSTKAAWVSINGYVDSYVPICAYQQNVNGPNLSTVINCAWPSFWHTDACGVNWYWFSMSQYLMGNNDHWFTAGTKEYTRVFVARGDGIKQGMYTATGDFYSGPSDSTACRRSQAQENAAIAPITYYLNGVPDDLECSAGQNSYAGCPFTCNSPTGCDVNYGNVQAEFSTASYRVNSSGQSTALTRYDKYGYSTYAPVPSGNWTYGKESGTCQNWPYYGVACEENWQCGYYGYYYWAYGQCSSYWTVMRQNNYNAESINVKRGESRSNSLVETWLKTKYRDYSHYEIGLVNRFYNANNYFVFWVNNLSGSAMIHGVNNSAWIGVGGGSTSANLLNWTRFGFEIRDRGSFVNGAFQPNGYCWMRGYVNGASVVANDSTNCAWAPRGSYGPYTYYMTDAQFWDLDARPRSPVY